MENLAAKPLRRLDIVLARSPEFKPSDRKWTVCTFDREKKSAGGTAYLCSGVWYLECIPYLCNEELLGTDAEPKDYASLDWGSRVLVSDSLDGEWKEALLMGYVEGEQFPWTVVERDAAVQALFNGKNPELFFYRYLKKMGAAEQKRIG